MEEGERGSDLKTEDVFRLRFGGTIIFLGAGLKFNIESLRVIEQTCVIFSFILFTQKILYSFCSPHDVREAVLQQEVSGKPNILVSWSHSLRS